MLNNIPLFPPRVISNHYICVRETSDRSSDFLSIKHATKNNKVTLSIGEQIFKALMSFVQVETMANITRHCKLNEIFKYNRASQYWNSYCRSKARAHALKSFPSFKIPNLPSRPVSLFRIGHLVKR